MTPFQDCLLYTSGSLLFGILAAVVRGQFHFEVSDYGLAGPMLIMPKLNPGTIMSVSIPLAVLVIGAENAQAIGVLKGAGYKVPINAMTIASGIGGIVTSFFGGHNANIAGPMTAIIAADGNGPKEYRYGGAVLNGIGLVAFGVLASYALGVVAGLPSALVSLLAGLALINILINALKDAFGSGMSVSYTHLDVYKRQRWRRSNCWLNKEDCLRKESIVFLMREIQDGLRKAQAV